MLRHIFLLALLGNIVSLTGLPLVPSAAQEFRVDTEVFIGEEKEPAAETLTIFSQGLVYDFLIRGPEEITMLDTVRGRFTLLDPARKVRCGLGVQELLDQTLSLETRAAESKDVLFMFAARPQFETKAEEYTENGQQFVRLNMTAQAMEYAVVARPAERPEALHAFRYFADQFARLNSLRPGNLPPGARLDLNKALAERKLLPLEITRTIPAANPLGRKIVVRSRHLVNWSLSGEDRKKIDRAGTCLAEFSSVSFDEYRAASAKPVPKTASK